MKSFVRLQQFLLIISLLLCCTHATLAQSRSDKPAAFKPFHQLGLTIGHEHSFNGRNADGEKTTLVLPFWGLDYNFRLAEKFSIGIHTDFILESFEVEKNLDENDETTVERTRPIAPALMGLYKPTEHWSFGLGFGGEFSKEEDYFLNRLSVEFSVEIRKGWEMAGSLQYDFRWNAYDTWTIGLGVLKAIVKTKKSSIGKNKLP